VTREMGLEVSLHGSNSEPLMSALGQKRTSDCHPLMSAIPPKADIAERRLDARFVPITTSPRHVRFAPLSGDR
jgi:hypothetical protein